MFDEELDIASYSNLNELLNQILMFVGIRKVGCLVDNVRINFIYLFIYLFSHLFLF